jgi:hypothetical protein
MVQRRLPEEAPDSKDHGIHKRDGATSTLRDLMDLRKELERKI